MLTHTHTHSLSFSSSFVSNTGCLSVTLSLSFARSLTLTMTSATASATVAPTASTSAYLNTLSWDNALRMTVAADGYYYRKPSAQAPSTTKSSAPSGAKRGWRAAPNSFLCSSSKVRLCVHALAGSYMLWVVTHHAQCVPCRVSYTNAAPTSVSDAGATATTTTTLYLYESADGVQLLLRQPIASLWSTVHDVGGLALLALSLWQKESVPHMMLTTYVNSENSTSSKEEEKKAQRSAQLQRGRRARQRHGAVGIAMVLLMAGMVAAGFKVRRGFVASLPPPPTDSVTAATVTTSSNRPPVINVLKTIGRALPWFAPLFGAFVPAMMGSGVAKKAAPHAIIGSALCKICLWVPLSHSIAAVLQRATGAHVSLENLPPSSEAAPALVVLPREGALDAAYNTAAGVSAVVIALWLVNDTRKMVAQAKKQAQQRQQQ